MSGSMNLSKGKVSLVHYPETVNNFEYWELEDKIRLSPMICFMAEIWHTRNGFNARVGLENVAPSCVWLRYEIFSSPDDAMSWIEKSLTCIEEALDAIANTGI